MGRGQRVRTRQPRMQRHRSRFGAETQNRRHRNERTDAIGVQRTAAQRAVIGEHEHAYPHADPAEVGDREIREHVAAGLLVVAHDEDHARGQQRHQLPEREERGHVARGHQSHERQAERCAENRGHGGAPRIAQRVAGVERRRNGDQRQRQQEEPAQSIDAQRRRVITAEGRTDRRRAEQHRGTRSADRGHPRCLHRQRRTPPPSNQRNDHAAPQAGHADGADQCPHAHRRKLMMTAVFTPRTPRTPCEQPSPPRPARRAGHGSLRGSPPGSRAQSSTASASAGP